MKTPATIACAAVLAVSVDAHGYLIEPAPVFNGPKKTDYVDKIDSGTLPAPWAGKKFNDNPDANADTFNKAFKELPPADQNIRKMMDPVGPDCGFTKLEMDPVDVSSRKDVTWANPDKPGEPGFIDSHTGPCEIWIDDTMVMHEDNCARKFKGHPASIPVDFSKCSGTCNLRFYWLALHEPMWQVYKNCVKIKNGAGGGSAPAPVTSTAPAPTTGTAPAPPTGTTPAPPTGTAPAPPTGTAPAPVPASGGQPSKAKCRAKARRRALRDYDEDEYNYEE
ncbi:hypothetical protein Poli38472_002984 [Pythium oligandrum]|uniref:Uncharacterized protein n=1 Tax=Pythium oligandrum TaxID=41045 RepID=A0A8K1FDM1_PYTOL|nr:hypothetical protein Poli38472_002984 [Pythium oligandrum]|eukprot:TMW57059.1 hypothetical protein Poli38472_002984 [Pythium oligandrum]